MGTTSNNLKKNVFIFQFYRQNTFLAPSGGSFYTNLL